MTHSLAFLAPMSTIMWLVFALLVLGKIGRKLITALTKIYI